MSIVYSPLKRSKNRRKSQGFTLIELMIVVAIISILLAVLAYAAFSVFSEGGKAKTNSTFQAIAQGINTWRNKAGKAPGVFPNSGKNSLKGLEKFSGTKALYQELVAKPLKAGKAPYIEDYEEYRGYLQADGTIADEGREEDALFVDGFGHAIIYWEWASKTQDRVQEDPTQRGVQAASSAQTSYARNKGSYDLYSAGEDEKLGTKDDLDPNGEIPMAENAFSSSVATAKS